MPAPLRASRRRFLDYRNRLKQRRKRRDAAAGGDADIPAASSNHGHGPGDRKHRPRSRSFLKLLGEFWSLLRGYRRTVLLVLLAASVSTLLGLIPLYGTKIVFDSVLRDQPLPARVPHWIHLPTIRHELLTFVAVSMVALATMSESISLWA